MPSLFKRSLVLSFSRLSNQAILLLSPVLLVRIISVREYGSYREFVLYSALICSVMTFGAAHSLPYFIPKYPEREKVWVTQVTLFILAASLVAIVGVWVVGDVIRSNTSFDFVATLQLYIFFFMNLDFVELYWLAKKRTDYVLYYSSGRLLARIVVLLWAAIATRNARSIVEALVVLEVLRFTLVFAFSIRNRVFTTGINRSDMVYQLSYFVPLGLGGVIEMLNRRMGQLFISTSVGIEALAMYFVGWFAVPIVNVFRGAIADVIFPEIMELKSANAKDALPLWQQATVWYCVLLFPITVLFAYYSDAIVIILFTEEYGASSRIFTVFSAMLVIACFDFHLPLRVRNANRFFVTANIVALLGNVMLIFPLYQLLGLIGPAIALVGSQMMMTMYLAYRVCLVYDIRVSNMLEWRKIAKIFFACVLCTPILVLGKFVVENLLVRSVLFGSIYVIAYLLVLKLAGVWDAFAEVRDRLGYTRLRDNDSGDPMGR